MSGAAPTAGVQRSFQLALCGDVMTGRGIDQALAHPSKPRLYEPYVRDAREYLRLAELTHGAIPRPLPPAAPWGDALEVMARADLRLVNLETAVTTSDQAWPGKGIHYRMNPANVDCLTAARLDCCVLANNHVLDWGRPGLLETLETLERTGIRAAGAGRDRLAAAAPAALPLPGGGRLLVFACGDLSSGIPRDWAAAEGACGVHLLSGLSPASARMLGERIRAERQRGDVVLASIHWGGNWGYEIAAAERDFAHALVDEAGVDLVHGHSSHHPRAIEVRGGRAILYGCGDFLNDYEGIGGYEEFRPDLMPAYMTILAGATGALLELEVIPFVLRRFGLRRPGPADRDWLADRLDRECGRFGAHIEVGAAGRLLLRWP